MARSILSVIAGYLVMAIAIMILFAVWFGGDLEATPTTAFLLFSLVYGFAAATAGGYVTALIAGRAEINHAAALAALAVVMGIVSVITAAGREPVWFQIANMVVVVAAILLGGSLRARQVLQRTDSTTPPQSEPA